MRRDPPRLVITVPLESSVGLIVFAAESYEDEMRLRAWLRESEAFAALPGLLERLLDDIDEFDARGTA